MRDIPLPRNLILLPLLLRCTSHPQLSDITTQRPGTGESTARTPWRDLHTPQITNNRARLVEWLSTSTAIITSAITYSRPARAARHRETIGRSSQPKAGQRLLRLELPSLELSADRSDTVLDPVQSIVQLTRPRDSQLPCLKPKPSYHLLVRPLRPT
jgi:hypothetical protein